MRYPDKLLEEMYEASDGAWQQIIEDAVHIYNKKHKTKYDTLDAFLYYVGNFEQIREIITRQV